MNITSAIDSSLVLYDLNYDKNLSLFPNEDSNENEFFNSTITTTILATLTTTTVSNIFHRLFNTTRIFPFPRLTPATTTTTSSSSVLNKHFVFKSSFNRTMRMVELSILSLTLPLYAIVLILFIELTVQRISSNTTISGGGSRSRSQYRRQRMRSLIWTSNYLLVDFLGLLYELIYVIIHLTGDLALHSLAGRFYCQLQVYLPLYLTALMAYSLTAISVYRRRHFVNLSNQSTQSTSRSLLLIITLWTMPIITSLLPAYLLTHFHLLKITQHEETNECQISYTDGSIVVAIYICYRLGNIFLLPLSISFICYLKICVGLIRMQRRFSRKFKRHFHIRKNLILQILFLFLNFAVFWLPAEIITLYAESRDLKDTVRVTKSLNILLDPLIITGFDTRFSSATQQLLSKWRLEEFLCLFNSNRHTPSSSASVQLITTRTGTTMRRLKQSTLKHTSGKTKTQQQTPAATWNTADDDITVLDSTANHISTANEKRSKTATTTTTTTQGSIRRKQQQRRRRQPSSQSTTKRQRSNQMRIKTTDNHVTKRHN